MQTPCLCSHLQRLPQRPQHALTHRQPQQHFNAHPPSTARRHCFALRAEQTSNETPVSEAVQSSASGSTQPSPTPPPSPPPQPPGKLLAAASVGIGVVAFLATRFTPGTPSLSTLEQASIPLDTALANGKPSLIEFYANWCQVCKESAPEVFEAEKGFKNQLNLVMLNIDNPKWMPEAQQYKVRGIPHFVFLDERGRQLGTAVGRFPQSILNENVEALAKGVPLPFTQARGAVSTLDKSPAERAAQQQKVEPRSHS